MPASWCQQISDLRVGTSSQIHSAPKSPKGDFLLIPQINVKSPFRISSLKINLEYPTLTSGSSPLAEADHG
jgi:hypothetical protein